MKMSGDEVIPATRDAVWKALNDPDVHQRLTQAGFEVMATDGPAVDRYTREQYERWGAFVKATQLKLDE